MISIGVSDDFPHKSFYPKVVGHQRFLAPPAKRARLAARSLHLVTPDIVIRGL